MVVVEIALVVVAIGIAEAVMVAEEAASVAVVI